MTPAKNARTELERWRSEQPTQPARGWAALKQDARRKAVIEQIALERDRFPVDGPDREAAIGFKAHRDELVALGFADSQVLTFGSARGTNALAGVERLHIAGRPMPPPDELCFLASVIHHDEAPIIDDITLVERAYGGQPYTMQVVDFVDRRVAALLKGARDDEVVQVIHRARLLTLDPQLHLDAPAGAGIGLEAKARSKVVLIIHSSHPIPGLRVDELLLPGAARNINAERSAEAQARVQEAVDYLRQHGEPVTPTAVWRRSGGRWHTVKKALMNLRTTHKEEISFKGGQKVHYSQNQLETFAAANVAVGTAHTPATAASSVSIGRSPIPQTVVARAGPLQVPSAARAGERRAP